MNLNTTIPLDFEKYWAWWIGELSTLVPDSVCSFLTQKRELLVISEHDDCFQFDYCVDGISEAIRSNSVSFDEDQVKEQIFQEKPEVADLDIVYKIPAAHGLLKEIRLPAVAQENLHNVVSFEMDRYTPFTAEQVYYDTRIVETPPDSSQIKVELALVSRPKLDEAFQILSDWGLRPNIVDVPVGDEKEDHYQPNFNLLPPSLRSSKRDLPKILNTALAIVLLGLLLALLIVPIWIKKSYLLELTRDVSEVSQIASEVQTLKKEADNGLRELNFLLEKKRVEPVVVEMLEELTKLIPDNAWLTNLQLKQRRLQIQGQSPGASLLIEAIESSPIFSDTRFVSPVTQDRRTGLERFQIAANVLNRRTGE